MHSNRTKFVNNDYQMYLIDSENFDAIELNYQPNSIRLQPTSIQGYTNAHHLSRSNLFQRMIIFF